MLDSARPSTVTLRAAVSECQERLYNLVQFVSPAAVATNFIPMASSEPDIERKLIEIPVAIARRIRNLLADDDRHITAVWLDTDAILLSLLLGLLCLELSDPGFCLRLWHDEDPNHFIDDLDLS